MDQNALANPSHSSPSYNPFVTRKNAKANPSMLYRILLPHGSTNTVASTVCGPAFHAWHAVWQSQHANRWAVVWSVTVIKILEWCLEYDSMHTWPCCQVTYRKKDNIEGWSWEAIKTRTDVPHLIELRILRSTDPKIHGLFLIMDL